MQQVAQQLISRRIQKKQPIPSPQAPRKRHISAAIPRPSTPRRDSQTLRLSDDRVIGFAEYGSPGGEPVIWCHGLPTSRGEVAEWDGLGDRLNARFIGIDRPGIGLSTFQHNRTILDHSADVRDLARHLGLRQYSLIGTSGGGPYALACAYSIPREELRSVGVLAGLGPLTQTGTRGMFPGLRLAWYLHSRTLSVLRLASDLKLVPAAQNPDPMVFVQLMENLFSKPKGSKRKEASEEEANIRLAIEASREHFRQGSAGYLHDTKLLTQHWGFELQDVLHPRVRLYYGTEDKHTPLGMGRFQAEQLPHGTLKEFPGESHFTIMDRGEDIVRDLLEID